jgi:hypothetical protein
MCRGLSRMQKTILGLLDGSLPGQVFRSGGALSTAELRAELLEAGILATEDQRQGMYTVWRACASLARRGLVQGERTTDCDCPWVKTISWRAAGSAAPPPRP